MSRREAPITFGGRVLHEELDGRLDEIVSSVTTQVGALVPSYGVLPREQLQKEFAAVVATTTRLFARVVRDGTLPEADDLEPLLEAAARRAEEGIPLGDILAVYHLGVSMVVDELATLATADDVADLVEVNRLLLAFLARAVPAAATGYLAASQETLSETQGAKQALMDALLEDGDGAAVAARVGLRLADRYAVISLSLGPHPDESSPEIDRVVASRRKLRRMRQALDISAPDALASMTAAAGTILVPLRAEDRVEDVSRLVGELSRAAGASVLAAVEVVTPEGVAEAVPLTGEVLEVAARTGRTEGLVQLQDVLVEYQLSRGSAARPRLAALLAPLSAHPDVLETLRVFVLEEGMNRRRTARRLNVHPNTVDYRLKRVRTLVGLDTSEPADLQVILAGLMGS